MTNPQPKPKIVIVKNGRYVNAYATAPDGFSWEHGTLHELVVSWAGSRKENYKPILVAIQERIRDAGPLAPCPVNCECRDE